MSRTPIGHGCSGRELGPLNAKDDQDRLGRREFFRRLWPLRSDEERGAQSARPSGPLLPLGPAPPCLKLTERLENPCVDCEAPCIASCEPDVIRLHQQDNALRGRAYLDFSAAGCTWCGDCREVCPAVPARENLPRRIGVALLDQEICMPWQSVVCISCQSVCPVQAILFDERGRPTVHPTNCDGCGMCISVCPVDALCVVPENPQAAAS